ncbi:MAG: FHA domain-containing protein [Paracoccaceae bacterium]
MKFLRDLIEQKSSEGAASGAAAAPGRLGAGNLASGHAEAEPKAQPFAASELYRIMDEDDDDIGQDAFDVFDDEFEDEDEAFDQIHAEDEDEDERVDAAIEPESPAAKAANDKAAAETTDEIVARMIRPAARPATAPAPAPQAMPKQAPAAERPAAPRPAPASAPAPMARPAPDTAARPVTRPVAAVAPVAPAAAASAPKPAPVAVSRPAVPVAPRSQAAPPQAAAPQPAPQSAAQPTPAARPAEAAQRPEPAAPVSVEVPTSSAGRGMGRAGRAKTRLLGFNAGMSKDSDPFARAAGSPDEAAYTQFPVGWLVVVDGPGRGAAFTLFNGVTQIGRGEGQTVRLDFGDNSISRENHAAIAYDAEQNSFFIGHGGKANLVRCNNMPVLSTQALSSGDIVRVGETSLRFIPLCGDDFQWTGGQKGQGSHAVNG